MGRTSDHNRAEARAFRQLAEICRHAVSDGATPDAAIPEITGAIDADAVAVLVERHRISTRAVEALATAMQRSDPSVARRLTRRARERRVAGLNKARWTAAISSALSTAGIRHLGVKGPILAQQIYGDAAARDSKDLDLLIDSASIVEAAAVLRVLGFVDASDRDAGEGRFANKHRSFTGNGIEVEMHTRLLDVEALLPLSFDTIWPRHETVLLGGVAVPALSPVDTLLYLSVHGAQHLWFRLKWLEDIARIVTISDPAVVADAIRIAGENGADPVVVGAVQMTGDVLGIRYAGPVSSTRASRALVRLSKVALAGPADCASAPSLGWIARKLPVQFGIARTWRYRRDLARMIVLAPRGFDAALPRGLRWLRLPLRPAMLLRDRWARR